MERKVAYSTLAEWFEYLNDDCDYENWSQYLIKRLSAYPLETGLDIGCGGGYFTRALQRAGYEMTGMDVSLEMLDKAQSTALKEGLRGEYIHGDIAGKKIARKYSIATAINDCLNYVEPQRLVKAFKNVYGCLPKGGVFLFDISSPKKFTEKLNGVVHVDDREDITYLSFTRFDGEKAELDVSLFVKNGDGSYTRHDETHVQYAHTEGAILEALREAGFVKVSVEGHLGEDKAQSDRLVFLAEK